MQELLEDDDVVEGSEGWGVGPKEETTTWAVGGGWKLRGMGESADDVGISYDWSKPL